MSDSVSGATRSPSEAQHPSRLAPDPCNGEYITIATGNDAPFAQPVETAIYAPSCGAARTFTPHDSSIQGALLVVNEKETIRDGATNQHMYSLPGSDDTPNGSGVQQTWSPGDPTFSHSKRVMPSRDANFMHPTMQPPPRAQLTLQSGIQTFSPILRRRDRAVVHPAPEKEGGAPTGAPASNDKKEAVLKSVEHDDALQPVARSAVDFYLCDDDVLVEEDPLLPHPAGKYAQAIARYASLPNAASLTIHPIPPRTIGSIQDQVHRTRLFCSCKGAKRRSKEAGSVCLKLYCACFATGDYCNEKCNCSASCFNNAAESNVQPRTQAIVEVLTQDPHAFRLIHRSIAQHQKDHRIRRLAAAKLLAKSNRKRSPNKKLPGLTLHAATPPEQGKVRTKGIDADKEDPTVIPSVAILTTQLPPSYYVEPLKVDNGTTVLTGLSYSLTHPRNRQKKPGVATKHIYHDLMLSPSKNLPENFGVIVEEVATSDVGPETKKRRIGETQLETFWNRETQKASVYFQAMNATMDDSQRPWSWFPFEDTQKQAAANFTSVKDDMEGISTVIAAAKIDTMARFYQGNRLKRGYFAAAVDGVVGPVVKKRCGRGRQDDVSSQVLICDELLAPETGIDLVVANNAQFKELTLAAAQDAALLQETARIIRRMARELCERRIHESKP